MIRCRLATSCNDCALYVPMISSISAENMVQALKMRSASARNVYGSSSKSAWTKSMHSAGRVQSGTWRSSWHDLQRTLPAYSCKLLSSSTPQHRRKLCKRAEATQALPVPLGVEPLSVVVVAVGVDHAPLALPHPEAEVPCILVPIAPLQLACKTRCERAVGWRGATCMASST